MLSILLLLAAAAVAARTEPVLEGAVVVEMTDVNTFEPATVTVRRGQTVTWTNPSQTKHTVTADPAIAIEADSVSLPEGAATFNSGPVDTGETFSHTFGVTGTWDYFCIPHELDGMLGTVIVEEAPAAAAEESGVRARLEAPAAAEGGPASADDGTAERQPTFVLGAHQPPRHREVRQAEGVLEWIYWLGNFHPPAVSLPLGLLVGAALAELLLLWTGNPLFRSAGRFCVWIGALSAAGAAILGWLLAGFRLTDGAWVLTTHRWLGTGAVVLALVLVRLVEKAESGGGRGRYRLLLFTTALVVLATGFFGGAMIYGLDHYAPP